MKIAIAGYGVEGEANYRYWSKNPQNELTIVDEAVAPTHPLPEGAKTILGPGVFDKLEDFDLVIRTAGLAPKKIKTNGKVWSATNEFFEKCPARIIGVTGSKGKGTTTSLIASILEKSGKRVWLVGNIGAAALDVLDEVQPDDVVVYELSSFQLWDIERSPQTAIVLYIEPEHLNVHDDLEDYIKAKANIVLSQRSGDTVIYNADNDFASAIALKSPANNKIKYPDSERAHVEDGSFYYGSQKLFSVDALQVKGQHNINNTLAAIDAVWPITSDPDVIEAGVRAFSGLPHRLAFVRSVGGVSFYDDSIATTPGSAIAALRAFPDEHKVIILGGSSKGSDFEPLVQEILRHDAKAILIGSEANKIADELRGVGLTNFEIMQGEPMRLIVEKAKEMSGDAGVVLLSPAAASFGDFKDYADRGDQFIEAVNGL